MPDTPPVTPPVETPATPPLDARPEWLDPKFKTVEEQAKAYTAAQKLIGKKTPAEGVPALTPPSKTYESIDDIVKDVGVDPAALAAAWEKDGKLSDNDYTKFKAKGYGKPAVDAFIATQFQAAQAANEKVAGYVKAAEEVSGGAEQMKVLKAWAEVNLPATKVAALSATMQSDPSLIPNVFQEIGILYAKSNGSAGSRPLVTGQTPPAAGQIKTTKEFRALYDRAANGDAAARKQLAELPDDFAKSLQN